MAVEAAVDPSARLFDAIHYQDTAAIETILDAHPDIINTKHATGFGWGMTTPLMEAISSRSCDCCGSTSEVVNFLVYRGADVNATGHMMPLIRLNGLGLLPGELRNGDNILRPFHEHLGVYDDLFPLHIAVDLLRTYKVEILLSLGGVDINQQTAAGETTLHHACRAYVDRNMMMQVDEMDSRTLSIVRMLIENGANVNCQDNFGMTPLHHACRAQKQKTVHMLLANGADITIKDCKNRTPLEYAALECYDLAKSLLMDCTSIPCQTQIETYEILASSRSCQDPYEDLLEAMHLRRKYRILKVAEEPLGCYKNVKECETLAELLQCAGNPALTMINAILARERIFKGKFFDLCEDTDYFRNGHFSAFQEAGLTNMNALQLRHVSLLEENGAYIDFGSSFSYTKGVLKDLAFQCKPNNSFKMENSVILNTVELLFRSLSKVQEELNVAMKPGLIEQLIIQFKFNMLYVTFYLCKLFNRALFPDDGYPEGVDERVSTPENDLSLLSDIFHKLWKQFPLLVSPNSGFMTPLPHFTFDQSYMANGSWLSWSCIFQYHAHVLKLFIDQGFDVDSVDSNGNTLLHVIASAKPNITLIKMLLENGADCFCRNKYRLTPLDLLENVRIDSWGDRDDAIELLKEYMYFKVLSLKCISAIKVRESNLSYAEHLPGILIRFVDGH